MPLVINGLGGGHTHTYTHILKFVDRSNTKKPGAPATGRCVLGLTTDTFGRLKFRLPQNLPFQVNVSRPLNSHDLVVRHTISSLISRLLVNLTISHDLAEILLLLCA